MSIKRYRTRTSSTPWRTLRYRRASRRLVRFIRLHRQPFNFDNDGKWGPDRNRQEAMTLGINRLLNLEPGQELLLRSKPRGRWFKSDCYALQLSPEEWLYRLGMWAVKHEQPIHYAQTRPIPYSQVTVHPDLSIGEQPWPTPIYTDCSGSISMLYKSAGLPDPNGNGYNGQGSSFAIQDHLPLVQHTFDLRRGDLITWTAGAGHVTMVMEPGADPLLFSHGMEQGPILVRYSVENGIHSGGNRYFLRGGF